MLRGLEDTNVVVVAVIAAIAAAAWNYKRSNSAAAAQTAAPGPPSNAGVLLLVAATVLCGSGLQISGKQMGNALPEHMFVILLLAVPLISVAFFIAAIAVGITERSQKFPKSKLAMMSTFDTLQMLLSMLALPRVSGKMQSVLSKTSIPLNMALQWLRGGCITSMQLVGAGLVLAGALAGILPGLMSAEASGADSGNTVWWCGVFLLSVIPAVLGVAYKETALADSNVEENYLNAWTAMFQGVFSVLLLPLVMALEGIPQEQLVPRLHNGLVCISGTNTTSLAAASPFNSDHCPSAWHFVALWLLLLFMYNAAMTALVARAGGTLMLATTLLITPVTNLAYSMPVLMGDHVEPISLANVLGLCVTMAGIVVYRTSRAASQINQETTRDKKEN